MNYLKFVITALFAALTPIKATMGAALALIVIDLIVGIIAAYKRHESITSAGLRRTLSKVTVYEIGIIAAFLIEHYLLEGDIPVVKLVSGAIAMVEATSILENLNSINGSPIFAKVLTMIGSKNDSQPPNPPEPPKAA